MRTGSILSGPPCLLVAASLAFFAPLVPAFAADQGVVVDTIERSFSVSGRPAVVLRNVDGRSLITAGSGTQVQIRAVKEVFRAEGREAKEVAEKVEVRIEQIGSRIEVEAKYPRQWSFFGRGPYVRVHFEVTAPAMSDVDAGSVDGALESDGLDGRLRLRTVDGDLTLRDCAGSIDAGTVDGDLTMEGVRGEVTAKTTDGDLNIEGSFQGVEAHTTDGGIDIRALPGSKAVRQWSIRSTDGNVRLALPREFSADLEADTDSGRITCELPIEMQGEASKRRLRGKLNGGGNLLRIETSDGNIDITRP